MQGVLAYLSHHFSFPPVILGTPSTPHSSNAVNTVLQNVACFVGDDYQVERLHGLVHIAHRPPDQGQFTGRSQIHFLRQTRSCPAARALHSVSTWALWINSLKPFLTDKVVYIAGERKSGKQ